MANLQEVRTRIASVTSTRQITSAMRMVSAAKFRRAQTAIFGMRPYADKLASIIEGIEVDGDVQTPYHSVRPVERVLLVVVTSNKGLCGAFNANVIKNATAAIEAYQRQGVAVSVLSLGKRGSDAMAKLKGLSVEVQDDLLDSAGFDNVAALAERVMQDFADKKYDRVEIVYNKFKNTLVQILTNEQFLPIAAKPAVSRQAADKEAPAALRNDYIYEPTQEDILREMVPLTLRATFYRILLDSLASEHGARMNAMQKATDNATDLLKELNLSYNKARQAAITNEIIEIVSGADALNG